MHIVAAIEEEYPAIVDVWEASVRATHDFLTEENIRFFKPLILNAYLPAVALYCAKDASGGICGFVGVANGNVEMLFVAPQSRGKGVGKQLLRFAISRLDARKLDVNEQNPSAIAFYLHMGFVVVGRSAVDGMGKPFPLLHMVLHS